MPKKNLVAILCILFITCLTSFNKPTDPETQKASIKQQKEALKTIIIDAGHGYPDGGAHGKYSNEADITLAVANQLNERLKQVLPDCKIIMTRTTPNLPDGNTDRNKANRYRAQMANDNHGDLFIAIHVNSLKERYERRIEGYRQETYYVYTGKKKNRKKVAKTRSVPIYKSYKLSCNRKGTETYIWAVGKNDQKKSSVGSKDDQDDMFGEQADSSFSYFDTPEAKILASLRTKRYFDRSRLMASLVEEEFKKEGRPSYGVKQRDHAGIWVLQATNMPSILVETGFICDPEEEDYLNSEKGVNEVSYAIMRAVLRYKSAMDNSPLPPADSSFTR
ncbi:N-acetylmuramoyl-L-alanine amidase [Segetibacter sp. 3557_3]|uniref:N-acetylmuramoyl-L-alanine amidase family protein n=1 Tax=Segetibacter sp. 3557_3 TaxID=2547429 RepID=UPI001058EF36|nr:N-acetylmuramoyl-L-alanine amidase [Segetibacter sp. 3557_3]TDH26388.1 N-acetylmuramoyl-L-alanine amidase [Segetibacter sp. 3557_3]